MAYLPNFEFDVFISYAHVDDLTALGSESPGWVHQFHEQLKIYLWKRAGRADSVKIWRDPVLDGNQLFDQTIQERVERSALFVALTSQGYVESEYCLKELHCFHQRATADAHGLAVGDRLRILNVRLSNIPISKWPGEFAGTSGFTFHDAAEGADPGNPLDPSDKPFQQPLRKLGDSIYRTLCDLKTVVSPAKAAEPEEASSVVYVGDTSDSLRNARKRLINELREQKGISVVSDVPPPFEFGAHDRRLREVLGAACLSVHLLDALAGREMEGEPGRCYPQAQAELAIAHGKAPFIWIPQQLAPESIEDEGHRQFLSQLENGSRTEGKYDFVRGSPSAITGEVLQKIEEVRSRRAQADTRYPSTVLLDTHFKDQLHTLELSKFLLERQILPLINPEEDDPRKNLKIFEERLKQVSVLIVFFGTVAEEWVRARLAAALQIAVAENYPLRACGVYLAPPRKPGAKLQLGQRLIPIELMDHTERFNAPSVERLLERIRE